MPELPIPEIIVFISIVLTYMLAAVLGIVQLTSAGTKYGLFLRILIGVGVILGVILLVMRAITISAIPLTRLFESMIVLTIVFGLIYLILSIMIRQIFFSSVMAWIILFLTLMAATVAQPASEPLAEAATPWAMAHGIAMILGAAATVFAASTAFLYLLGQKKLKQKKVTQVVGKIPNIEKLEQMTAHSLEACFLFLTFGLVSGAGMAMINAAALEKDVIVWLTDSKIVLISFVWLLLGIWIVLKRLIDVKGRVTAYVTMVVFVLILYAFVGSTIFCGSKHTFTKDESETTEIERQLQ